MDKYIKHNAVITLSSLLEHKYTTVEMLTCTFLIKTNI